MGGVDLCDMFHALYRIDRRSKKYYLRIVYFLIGVALSNAWLIYKKNVEPISLREFQTLVSLSLMSGKSASEETPRPGRKRSLSLNETLNDSIVDIQNRLDLNNSLQVLIFKTLLKLDVFILFYFKKEKKRRPNYKRMKVQDDIRYDCFNHFPFWSETKSRCQLDKKHYTFVKCSKCDVFLCLLNKRNCFHDYHHRLE
jgi:hypothetical protein